MAYQRKNAVAFYFPNVIGYRLTHSLTAEAVSKLSRVWVFWLLFFGGLLFSEGKHRRSRSKERSASRSRRGENN